MLEQGAVEEVERLMERRLKPDLPGMRAIGVREIADWPEGEISREEMLTRGQIATRQYAKRQSNWFAHQPPPDWPRTAPEIRNKKSRERQCGKKCLRKWQSRWCYDTYKKTK